MSMNPRLLRPTANDSPASIPGLALWLDAAAADALYTTDAGPVEPADETEIANLAGLEAWWDASDATTVTLDSGRVSELADKSGNGRDAVNATTGTTQPTYETAARNGLNVVRFDAASTQRLTVASSTATFNFLHDGTASYVAAVFSTGTVADPNGIFGIFGNNATSTSSRGFILQVDDRTPTFNMLLRVAVSAGVGGTWAAIQETANAFVPGQTHVAEALVDADNATAASRALAFADGAGLPSTNASTLSPSASNANFDLQIGASGNNSTPHTGDICEILIFSQQPTASQRARIAKYLANKWGIANVHAPAVTASQPVGYWRDRSGTGLTAVTADATKRPLVATVNGRRALDFDGVNDTLTIQGYSAEDGLTGLTRFAVAFADSSASSILLTVTDNGISYKGGARFIDLQSSNIQFAAGNSGFTTASVNVANTNYTLVRDAPHVLGSTYDGSKATLEEAILAHYDGATLTPTSTSGAVYSPLVSGGTRLHMGSNVNANNWWNGKICEYLVYNRVLDPAQRRKVEVYLARRWGITLAPQVSNADAQDWIARVYAAGSTVSQPVANAVSDFITGCQSDGIWDAMKSVVLLAGADTLAGALAPMKGTAPTLYNFASGDYNKTSGLKGNGSSTYLDSNRANTADPLDDNHNVVYITTASNSASATAYMGNGNGGPGLNQLLDDPVNNFTLVRNRTSAGDSSLPDGLTGFLGTSRISSTGYALRGNGSSAAITAASEAIESSTLAVFARRSGGSPQLYSPARLSFYSIGESLDLTLLDARVSALMTAIGVS